MKRREHDRHIVALATLLLALLLAACGGAGSDEGVISIPPSIAGDPNPAVEARPADTTASQTETEDVDQIIEEALQTIDASICNEAAAAQSELAGLRAQGVDVTELEQAMADLLQELENCRP